MYEADRHRDGNWERKQSDTTHQRLLLNHLRKACLRLLAVFRMTLRFATTCPKFCSVLDPATNPQATHLCAFCVSAAELFQLSEFFGSLTRPFEHIIGQSGHFGNFETVVLGRSATIPNTMSEG